MIKNIVFDFGGVIVDIDRDKAVQAFIKLGLADADTRLDKYHQTGIFQELEEGKLSADEFRKQLGDLCGRPLTMEETKQAWLGFFNEVNLNKLDYILELRKSYHVYILSNTNPFVMSWACGPDFSSKKKPLNDYCDKLYLSYQIGHTKPAPEIFEFMVNDCNIIPSET
ncbi:HAD family phosphatase, partial [Bacteroides ovatus]